MLKNDNLKTFFLFPQKLVFEEIAEKLVADQNEAFVLNNRVEFKDALKLFNKNTLAFINIDSLLSENEWIEYVKSLKEDPHYSGIQIGIMSFNANERLMNIYKNELKIECGYHVLSLKNNQFEQDILKIVSEKKSKSGFPILRLDFDRTDPAFFIITDKTQVIKGKIDSLSTAAMSVTLESDKMLKQGMELNNITISYNESSCKLMGSVAGNSQHNKTQFIIKFSSLYNEIHQNPLTKIIHNVLDTKMRELVR